MGQYDIEDGAYRMPSSNEKHRDMVDETGAVPGETFVMGDSLYHKLQRFAGRMRMEQRGIERVPEDERTDRNTFKIGTMVRSALHLLLSVTPDIDCFQWLAANMVVSSFAIGALAVPVFYLGFVDAFLVILFINILGIIPVCFFSTFGPRFGMRQMILSRYFFGYYGVKIGKLSWHTAL